MKFSHFARRSVRTTSPLPTARLPYIDVTLVISGVMRYTLNEDEIELHAGDAIIFREGDIRARKSGGAAEYYSFNITFSEENTVPGFCGALRNCVNEEIMTLLELFENCHSIYTSHAMEKSKHCFLMLYYILYEKYKESKQDTYVSRIKQCIADHITEPITLTQISREVFLSPNYCNHIFKTQTGCTISEYILRTKMERAKHLLLTTPKSLADVATSLGYKQYSYFSRIFKKEVGVSPVSFRKSYSYSTPEEI